MTDMDQTNPDPRDRAIDLLERRVADLETELDYWRRAEELKEAALADSPPTNSTTRDNHRYRA